MGPSPKRIHGGGTEERMESAGGLESQAASNLIPPGKVSKD